MKPEDAREEAVAEAKVKEIMGEPLVPGQQPPAETTEYPAETAFEREEPAVEDATQGVEEPAAPVETSVLSAPEETLMLPAKTHGTSFVALHKWWIVAIAVLLTAASAAAYWLTRPSEPTLSNTPSTVQVKRLGIAPTLQEGSVEYSLNGKTWNALEENTNLKEGTQVRTSADGRVVLTLDDGSAIRLDRNSVIRLKSLHAKNIQLENTKGQVYTRVVASVSRAFTVLVGGDRYVAKGTAYRTTNTPEKRGVEVYQSTVVTGKEAVTEGNAYFTETPQADQLKKVVPIDLKVLKKDEFIKWNSEQDKKTPEFASKLGVLTELDKQPSSQLSGSVSNYSAVLSWTFTDADTSGGIKIVRSTSTSQPVYPGNDAVLVSGDKTTYTQYFADGKTYYFRVCAYHDGVCDGYSNNVKLTIPLKQTTTTTTTPIVLKLSGTTLSWTMTGTAEDGFKVVAADHTAPVYPSDGYVAYLSDPATRSYNFAGKLDPGKWYIRVCKYTGSGCTDYSNELTYTQP